MNTIKLACPHCEQHVEIRADEEAFDHDCPSCSKLFNPQVIRNQRAAAAAKAFAERPPSTSPPTLSQRLEILRADTAYPDLRATISVIHIIGTVILGVWSAVEFLVGIVTGQDTTTTASGAANLLTGFVLLILTAMWWKLCKPIASLTVDIADACIDISRRHKP